MKAARKIKIRQLVTFSGVMFIVAGLVVLCTPNIELMAHEMDYSRHTGAHNGAAYVAEQEVREKAKSEAANNNARIATAEKIVVTNTSDADQTKVVDTSEK